MRRIFFLCFAIVVWMGGCTEPEPLLPPLTREEISGTRLWERFTEESDYTAYGQWPGHEGKQPGQSPHGVTHRVFANNRLFSALPTDEAPEGTLLVKENYNAADELIDLTVMAKVKGFDPENGDWFWAAYGPDGSVKAEGSPAMCLSCHSGMKGNDYVIVQPLDEALKK